MEIQIQSPASSGDLHLKSVSVIRSRTYHRLLFGCFPQAPAHLTPQDSVGGTGLNNYVGSFFHQERIYNLLLNLNL